MSDFEWRNVKGKIRNRLNLNMPEVILGDETGKIYDDYLPNHVLVRRLYANNTYGPAFPVLGPAGNSVILKPGTRVKLGQTSDRKIQVQGYDVIGGSIDGTNLMNANIPSLPSGGFIGQQSIITALVTPQNIPDLTVIVKAWIIIIQNTAYGYPGSNSVDLSSLVPASGNNCYAVVFLQADYSTISVQASTARSIADIPLGVDDIQECVNAEAASSTPLAAVKLYGGQTTILNTDIVHDLRQMINTSSDNTSAQATTSADATVANTAAETTLIGTVAGSLTFAANRLSRLGRTIKITASGYVSDTGTPTLQLKFKIGGTTILDSTAITLGSGISNKLWKFEGLISVQTAGASGKVKGQGQFYQNGVITDIVNTAQASLDLTAALTVDLTATWSVGNPSNTITCSNFLLELLN